MLSLYATPATLSVLLFALPAFYVAYGYVNTGFEQQAVDVRLY